MFTPERMAQLHVVFSERDIDAVAHTVVRLGMVQVIDTGEIEPWAQDLQRGMTRDDYVSHVQRRDRIESIMQRLGLPRVVETVKDENPQWSDIDTRLDAISHQLQEVESLRDRIEQEYERLHEIRRRIEETAFLDFSLGEKDSYSYLSVEVGRVGEKNLDILKKRLEGILHVVAPLQTTGGMTTLVAITLRRDQARLESALAEAGFERIERERLHPQDSTRILKDIDRQMEETRQRLEHIQRRIRQLAEQEGSFLRRALFFARREELKQKIVQFFRRTEHAYLLSGWVPSHQIPTVVAELKRATRNRCVIETRAAEEVEAVRSGKIEVPVQMKNPKLLKPFEWITTAYGVPAYKTIDPTPFLALSFVFMFGMMFGDVGHGLVLLLSGIFFASRKTKPTLQQAGMILIYTGFSSVVFGFLFGSFFGIESVLPALWIKPMRSIPILFKTALYFGIGMITVAMVINILNGLVRREYLHVVFDKAGVVAGVLYWCGILMVSRFLAAQSAVHRQLPALVPFVMVLSATLLFFREPIIHLAEGKKRLFPEGVATGLIGGFMEVLEIFLGFLTNTVSFIRVAAFGLAHAGLFMAIFTLSNMVGGVGSILVQFFGNLLIILLEGMVVTIQVMRLEFYEFFGRFFREGSVSYRPVKIEGME